MSIRKRLRKNSKVSYQVKLKSSSGSWITKTFNKRREATIFEAEMKLRLGKSPESINQFSIITLNDYWNTWRINSRLNVSDGWKKTQDQMFRDYIKSILGSFRIRNINSAHISLVLSSAKSKGRSPQTIMHIYNILNKLFSDAYLEYEYISRNPVKKSHRPTVPIKESFFLTEKEVVLLLNYVKEKRYGLAIWIQVFCGLRVGEVQVLKWSNINFDYNYISIRGTYARKSNIIQDYPKGKRWHSVAIPKELGKFLNEAHKAKTSDYIFPSGIDGFLSYHSYYKVLKSYSRQLGLSHNLSTHSLRHSTSLIYLRHGASKEDLQALFSHSSISVTDRYIHDFDFRHENISSIASNINILGK